MRKFTAEDVFNEIDLSQKPHGKQMWTFASGPFSSYCGPGRYFTVHDGEKFLTEIAESLSLDGTVVNEPKRYRVQWRQGDTWRDSSWNSNWLTNSETFKKGSRITYSSAVEGLRLARLHCPYHSFRIKEDE